LTDTTTLSREVALISVIGEAPHASYRRGEVAGIASFKYRAFLSYSHRDAGWAKWLHARIEGFRFDKDIVGRETPLGPVPKTLRPIVARPCRCRSRPDDRWKRGNMR
jgi:hypothetical protein